ncbi:YbaK/EbsC family protein [Aestuariibius sp. HNIBRBA575]|uniref:YbaK/EbsC family protein n=1 Tax=Aestuariibius sp. HNIBRBA575 TaxID=3233343 RepID=UPI0034A1C8FE
MSKSLQRVTDALTAAGLGSFVLEMDLETRTAAQAAEAAECDVDQIAKSIIFEGTESGTAILFLTAGGNQVDIEKASAVVGEPLGRAHPKLVRDQTGFAIGGVAPVGHLNPIRCFMDPKLADYSVIYAAAGTPKHIFPITPDDLVGVTGAKTVAFTT